MARVLLIDDTPEIAELLTFALRDRGHEVVNAGYDAAVADLIVAHQAEAVVLDCTVFDLSAGLFDTVRQHPDLADLPVVIISDTPDVADEGLRSREARRVLLIPKPFTGSQVARALDDLLTADASR